MNRIQDLHDSIHRRSLCSEPELLWGYVPGSTDHFSLLLTSFASTFPAVSSIHSGRYEDGSSESSFLFLQCKLRHLLPAWKRMNVTSSTSGRWSEIAGILLGLGIFLFFLVRTVLSGFFLATRRKALDAFRVVANNSYGMSGRNVC